MDDEPIDFAARALKITRTDEANIPELGGKKPEVEPPPVIEKKEATQKEPDKNRLPTELFDGKKEPVQKEEESTTFEIDKITDPEFKDAKRKAQWDEVKTQGREWEKKAKAGEAKATELEARIKELDGKGKDTEGLQAKLEALEKQNAEWREIIQKVNIELDPEFRKTHIEGRKKLIENARAIVEESGVDANVIETALNLRGKPRIEAIKSIEEELGSFQSGRLGRVIDALNELDASAEAKRSSPDKYIAEQQARRTQQESEQRDKMARTANLAYDAAEKKTAAELEVLRPVDGNDWWNDQGNNIRKGARELYLNNEDPQVAATVCLQAKAMPVYRDLFLNQRQENAKLSAELAEKTAELKKLFKTTPPLRGGGSAPSSGPKDFATVAHNTMTGNA